MSNFVTETGFDKKTLVEIKTELETAFQGIFGDDIDLDAEGSFGQIIGILSKREADLWDGAQEIYTSRNPNEAIGTSLDNISAETGIQRIDASKTQVFNTLLFGDEATVIAAGKKAKQENIELTYSLLSAITITKTAARQIDLEPNTPSGGGGETYTVNIDSTPYTYVAIGGDTKADIINELISLITAGSWEGVASNIDDTYLRLYDLDTDFNASWTGTLTLELLASGGNFEADDEGPNPLPANTLTVIATPVSGWDDINNPAAGNTGRDVETDDQLRIRRAQAFLAGNATDEAIRSALLNRVIGIESANVTSNRCSFTDSDGRPPHSFEAVVAGGVDANIAQVIWETMSSGIQPYGNQTVNITDSQGNPQEIKFSRAVNKYIWVKVKRDFYNEEEYPTSGDDLIKSKIVEWSLLEFEPGVDVIRQRINTPVYEVPGIGDIEITIDATDTPSGSPVYAEQNIDITAREIAEFDITRIIVEDLTP